MEALKAENTTLKKELGRVNVLLSTYKEKLDDLMRVVSSAEDTAETIATQLHTVYYDILHSVGVYNDEPKIKKK
jgi:vacuolar-type H+-ATPase subunit D/Vma8